MTAGFIYVLENDAMPLVVKIGKTTRHPNERAAELFTTGVPLPFSIAFAMYCRDINYIEQAVHQSLAEFRVHGSREFFKVDIDECVKAIFNNVMADSCMIASEEGIIVSEQFIFQKSRELNLHPYDLASCIRYVSNEALIAATQVQKAKEAELRAERASREGECES